MPTIASDAVLCAGGCVNTPADVLLPVTSDADMHTMRRSSQEWFMLTSSPVVHCRQFLQLCKQPLHARTPTWQLVLQSAEPGKLERPHVTVQCLFWAGISSMYTILRTSPTLPNLLIHILHRAVRSFRNILSAIAKSLNRAAILARHPDFLGHS